MPRDASLKPQRNRRGSSGAGLPFESKKDGVCLPPRVESFEKWADGHRVIILAVLLFFSLALAWHNRFMLDDAFISFTYARNLVAGDGLTWFGNRIEGYTNFLWVLWIAVGLLAHVNVIVWSQAGGMLAYAAAIYAVWRLGYLVSGLYTVGIVSVLLFSTNFTVSSFATSGLETMLQTALIGLLLVQYFLAAGGPRNLVGRCFFASLLAAAAILTRPDSGLPCVLIFAALLWLLGRRRASAKAYCALLIPIAILLGTWLLWKGFYYGRLLPNSFYAKLGWNVSINVNGLVYLGRFFHWYLLWPVVALCLVAMIVRRSLPDRKLAMPIVLVGAWFAYIIAIGGDFMEFRFLVPVLPMLFLIVGYLVVVPLGCLLIKKPVAVAVLLTAFLGSISFVHVRNFRDMTGDKTLDSIPLLSTFYGFYPDGDWTAIAEPLRAECDASGVLIATTAAGAIPYYSGLRTIDMWGVNDRVVAQEGIRAGDISSPRPQKVRYASVFERPEGQSSNRHPDDYSPRNHQQLRLPPSLGHVGGKCGPVQPPEDRQGYRGGDAPQRRPRTPHVVSHAVAQTRPNNIRAQVVQADDLLLVRALDGEPEESRHQHVVPERRLLTAPKGGFAA